MTRCAQTPQLIRKRLYGKPVPADMVLGWTCDMPYCGNPEHFILRENKRAGWRDYKAIRRRLEKLAVGKHFDLPDEATDDHSLNRFRTGLLAGLKGKTRFILRTLPEKGVRIIRMPDWKPGERTLNVKKVRDKYPVMGHRTT